MDQHAMITVRAGRLHCGALRRYLQRAAFLHPEVSWLESAGWLEREFTVKGPAILIAAINTDIHRWAQAMDEAADGAQCKRN